MAVVEIAVHAEYSWKSMLIARLSYILADLRARQEKDEEQK